ncbi:MAG: thioredoxin domain-containing protein [Gemmatimonadetes bacterium]|nr:thioredoxin domain-containing protein [Gemmatimonadota bacterium]
MVLASVAVAVATWRAPVTLKTAEGQVVQSPSNDQWQELQRLGQRRGAAAPKHIIAEFSDLQCPFCKRFHGVTQELLARRGGEIAHVLVHFPLASHPYARAMAEAAVCAEEQGALELFVATMFAYQGTTTSDSWLGVAAHAGVDTLAMQRCVIRPTTVSRVDRGVEVAKRIGIRGTPTVLVDGRVLPKPPTLLELEALLDSLDRIARN